MDCITRKDMADSYDLIVRGGIVVNHDGEGRRDIGVTAGRIAAIGDLGRASAGATIDAPGLHGRPGVIDTQVHFREPGLSQKEDLETGSRSAVLGGVTGVFEMPNTNPLTTTAAARARTPRTSPSSSGCRAAPASRCSWDRRPARSWSRTTTACATS